MSSRDIHSGRQLPPSQARNRNSSVKQSPQNKKVLSAATILAMDQF